jgi:hypothetical protein
MKNKMNLLSKKRTLDQISNSKLQKGNCAASSQNFLLGVYKDNFCDCGSDICKSGANQRIKVLFK